MGKMKIKTDDGKEFEYSIDENPDISDKRPGDSYQLHDVWHRCHHFKKALEDVCPIKYLRGFGMPLKRLPEKRN